MLEEIYQSNQLPDRGNRCLRYKNDTLDAIVVSPHVSLKSGSFNICDASSLRVLSIRRPWEDRQEQHTWSSEHVRSNRPSALDKADRIQSA